MDLIDPSGMWLVAIGKTTAHSLWIGALILALLKLILTFIPARYSGTRYTLSVVALLLLFSSCIATFLILRKPASPVSQVFSRAHAAIPWDMLRPAPGEPGAGDGRLFALFAYIYFTGIMYMGCRSAFSTQYLRRLRRSGTPVELRWRKRFLHLRKSLGIRRHVDLLQSARVNSPMLLGYLKPVIMVPAGMFMQLPLDQVETILIHELYHLKRRDHLINRMQLFIESVLFYHPVAWIISGQIRFEREHCCDDRVLKATDKPLMYAKALIHLAGQHEVSRLVPGAVGPGKNRFSSRIRRILNRNTMKTTMRDKVLSLALLAGSVVLLLAASGFIAGPSYFRIHGISDERITGPKESVVLPAADTIPEKKKGIVEESDEEPDWEMLEKEMEAAREDAERAMEEIDWDQMKEEMKAAREEAKRAMEEIDWDQMKEEMEAAREEAKRAMEEIDWDQMKEEIEAAREEAKRAMEEIDWDQMKMDIENSMNEINWDQIREKLEKSSVFLDSIKVEMDR